jgi:hypothetical protein
VQDEEIIIALRPAPARRAIGAAIVAALGALLIWLALVAPPASALWLVFLIGLGALALWGAWRMWLATGSAVELTEGGLRDSDGTLIAAFDEIEAIDRGMFAFKPSNGFLLRLGRPGPRAWRPGLWWRAGRRVGVGGLTPRGAGRAMADAIQIRLAARDR